MKIAFKTNSQKVINSKKLRKYRFNLSLINKNQKEKTSQFLLSDFIQPEQIAKNLSKFTQPYLIPNPVFKINL